MNRGTRGGMAAFVVGLARPYRAWLVIILFAMLVETLTALALPWPLKVVIDSVIGGDPAAGWVVWLVGPALAAGGTTLAAVAAFSLVLLACLGGIASYVDNYFTENVGQWVANDLRIRVYDHLEHLSFTYYDTHQTGVLLSTVTDDVSIIQEQGTHDELMSLGRIYAELYWTREAASAVTRESNYSQRTESEIAWRAG